VACTWIDVRSAKALWFDRAELAASLAHRVPGLPVDWGIPVARAAASEQLLCPREAGQMLLRDYEPGTGPDSRPWAP
jgi:hypothetical protein